MTTKKVTEVVWENKWDSPYRKVDSAKERDPYDEMTYFRGTGYMEMGNGLMRLSGHQPRFYVDLMISGVEATFQYMKTGYDGQNWSGGVCGVRSISDNHYDGGDAHTYYFRLRHDNKVDFYREITHGESGTILNSKSYNVEVDTWYDFKFECYNENGVVKLKGYINNELVLEAEDSNQHMYNAIGEVFIRNTDVEVSTYKNFIVKEIKDEEPVEPPVEPEKPCCDLTKVESQLDTIIDLLTQINNSSYTLTKN